MSTFTQFSAKESLEFDESASAILGKTYYRSTTAFRYYIGSEGSDKYVDVPAGFLTDGASVPWIAQWLIPPLGDYAQAATLHDWLCEHYYITQVINGIPSQVTVTRKDIDAILYEAMGVLGVAKWRKTAIIGGVDLYRIVMRPTKPVVAAKKTSLQSSWVAPTVAPVVVAAPVVAEAVANDALAVTAPTASQLV